MVELDMIGELEVEHGAIAITIKLGVPGCPLRENFQEQIERALLPLTGVERILLSFDVMTAEEKAALTMTTLRGGVAERTLVARGQRTGALRLGRRTGARGRDRRAAPRAGTLDPVLREAADNGVPVLEAARDSEAAEAIVALAESVARTRRGQSRDREAATGCRRLRA